MGQPVWVLLTAWGGWLSTQRGSLCGNSICPILSEMRIPAGPCLSLKGRCIGDLRPGTRLGSQGVRLWKNHSGAEKAVAARSSLLSSACASRLRVCMSTSFLCPHVSAHVFHVLFCVCIPTPALASVCVSVCVSAGGPLPCPHCLLHSQRLQLRHG